MSSGLMSREGSAGGDISRRATSIDKNSEDIPIIYGQVTGFEQRPMMSLFEFKDKLEDNFKPS